MVTTVREVDEPGKGGREEEEEERRGYRSASLRAGDVLIAINGVPCACSRPFVEACLAEAYPLDVQVDPRRRVQDAPRGHKRWRGLSTPVAMRNAFGKATRQCRENPS